MSKSKRQSEDFTEGRRVAKHAKNTPGKGMKVLNDWMESDYWYIKGKKSKSKFNRN